jgi:chromosome segregation ATPase
MEGLGENFDPAISFSFSNEDRARWEEQVEAIRERSDNYRQEYQALRERYRDQEMSADEKKKMEKELKAFEEDWKNNQDKWQSELDHWKLEQEHWQAEQEKWQTEHHRSNGFQQALTAELIRDNLISDPGDYSFKLSAKSVQVNGKKLSDEQHAKYIDLYKRVTGKSMEKGDSYTIELHN